MQANQVSQNIEGEVATPTQKHSLEVDKVDNNNKTTTMKVMSKTDQDIVRLIGQHLRGIGLNQTAEKLIAESGCEMEDSSAANLRAHVMNGNWEKAASALEDLGALVTSPMHMVTMRFLLLEQKYLEYLEEDRPIDALTCLRYHMTPLGHDTKRVHELSTYLMANGIDELREMSGWEGKGVKSRQNLLEQLQVYLPPNVMLPPRRLLTLLNQAVERQREHCLFHNTSLDHDPNAVGYLDDHLCSQEEFPCYTTQVLNDHRDEVWFCAFSPDGKRLATGSKDSTILIYTVNLETHELCLHKCLDGHTLGVSFITWSPNGSFLIACGPEECGHLWIWNMTTYTLHKKMSDVAEDNLTCAAWQYDNSTFVTGGLKGHFFLCDLDGVVLEPWEGVRIQGLWPTPDSPVVLAVDTQHRVKGYNFEEHVDYHILQEDHPIMSFSVSENGRLALVNVATQGVHLWDLKDRVLLRKFQGMTQGYYTIYSCFGGPNQDFVASGSEDAILYIFHTKQSRPVMTLKGHLNTVNCVHWNPKLPSMLASASDDGTVRIWGPLSKAMAGEIDFDEVASSSFDLMSNNDSDAMSNNDGDDEASADGGRSSNGGGSFHSLDNICSVL